MKVTHLTSVHPRKDSRIFHKECSSLARAGHSVTLLVADGFEPEDLNGVHIESVLPFKNRLLRLLIGPYRFFRAARAFRADVYHLHDPELIILGILLKIFLGARIIYDAHEDLPKQIFSKQYLPAPLRKPLSRLVQFVQWITLPWLDGLVTATPSIRNSLFKLNKNIVDIKNFPIIGELSTSEDTHATSRAVCYVGGLFATRGIVELIEAAALLPDNIEILLAGPMESESFHRSLEQMDGWQHTQYLGVLGREGVRDLLSRSAVGMVTLSATPNHLESYPTKMFEYMSAGLPVIASDLPLWREIVEGAQCGVLVDPGDAKAVSEAILAIVDHQGKAKEMGMNGQRAVLEKYNWELEAKRLINFYVMFQPA